MEDYSVLNGKIIKNVESKYSGELIVLHFTDGTFLQIEEGGLGGVCVEFVRENDNID